MSATDRFLTDIQALKSTSNFRSIPLGDDSGQGDGVAELLDFTSNDYLGIARRSEWTREFLDTTPPQLLALTSSASRLLASQQQAYRLLESRLEELYGKPALIFNSGYHANTGIISAIADRKTLIVADRLVHASIIDGAMLSKAKFTRFPHNDYGRLAKVLEAEQDNYDTILVVVESVYSMDGDEASINTLIEIKKAFPKVILYVDEAHAVGCYGPQGLGLVAASSAAESVDITVGTFGKALASQGAYAIVSPVLKEYLVNHARSLIFSTAIPPISAAWTLFVVNRMLGMDSERAHLLSISQQINRAISQLSGLPDHDFPKFDYCSRSAIQPFVIGNSSDTLKLSGRLAEAGMKVLPIRTPTVPPGTERLRISLSAAHTVEDVQLLIEALVTLLRPADWRQNLK